MVVCLYRDKELFQVMLTTRTALNLEGRTECICVQVQVGKPNNCPKEVKKQWRMERCPPSCLLLGGLMQETVLEDLETTGSQTLNSDTATDFAPHAELDPLQCIHEELMN